MRKWYQHTINLLVFWVKMLYIQSIMQHLMTISFLKLIHLSLPSEPKELWFLKQSRVTYERQAEAVLFMNIHICGERLEQLRRRALQKSAWKMVESTSPLDWLFCLKKAIVWKRPNVNISYVYIWAVILNFVKSLPINIGIKNMNMNYLP